MQFNPRHNTLLAGMFFFVLLYGNINKYAVAQCVAGDFPFVAGETILYDAVYSWGFIWLEAAEVSFAVTDTVINQQPAFHFLSTGTSLPKYDWFFKVRDKFQSIASTDSLQPYYYSRQTYEGDYKVDNSLVFNYHNKLITTKVWNSDNGGKSYNLPIKKCGADLLTAVYKVRSLDFSKYEAEQKIPLRVIIDGQWYDLYIKYLGKEELVLRTGETYNCLKIRPLLVEGTIFNGGEDMTIWLTDDDNRVPIMIDAKILIGSVKAVYKSSSNLKQVVD